MRRSISLVMDPIPELLECVQLAEQGGFETAWTIDWNSKNAFVRLAAAAMVTKRIKLATGITYAFARSPLLTAAAAQDIDEVSGGRMVLGLGTGTKRMNEDWYGVRFEKPAAKMREVVQIVKQAFASQHANHFKFDGDFYHLKIVPYSRAVPVRPDIPVYVAGVNPLMISVAGEVSDGLVGHPLYSRRYIAEVVTPALQRGLDRSGRSRDQVDLASYVITSISHDAELARQEARNQIAFYSTVKTYDRILDLHGWESEKQRIRGAFRTVDIQAMAGAVSDDMIDQIAVAGTPDQCREQLARYDGLIDQVILYAPTFGISPQRILENHRLIIETFAQSGQDRRNSVTSHREASHG